MSYGQNYANDLFAIDAAASERAKFLQRTYLHLFGAILAFMGLEAVIFNVLDVNKIVGGMRGNGNIGMLVVIGGFMLVSWIARSWANNAVSPAMQYLGLALYTIAEAIFFVPILWFATMMDQGGGQHHRHGGYHHVADIWWLDDDCPAHRSGFLVPASRSDDRRLGGVRHRDRGLLHGLQPGVAVQRSDGGAGLRIHLV